MLSDKLKQLRKEKNLSQYEAAKLLGFSRGKLANYEQASRQPDYDTLKKIANFYDVSIDYLLGRSKTTDLTDNEKEFMEDSKELTIKELTEKYELNIDGEKATEEEIKAAIAFIRSLRGMK